MALLKVASWNVEHFQGKPDRAKRVVKVLSKLKPDVFAIYEVEGKSVYDFMRQEFPTYSVSITEGEQTQEILVGARSSLAPFFSNRPGFRSGVDQLRPGTLVTVRKMGMIIHSCSCTRKAAHSPATWVFVTTCSSERSNWARL